MPDNRRARTPPPRSVTTEGLCLGDPDLYDYDRLPGETEDQRSERLAAAEATCDRCPVLAACRRWAKAQPQNTFHGIVAGQRFQTNRYPKKFEAEHPPTRTARAPEEGRGPQEPSCATTSPLYQPL